MPPNSTACWAGLAESAEPGEWMSAAKAIMTTDTFPKVATATRQARQGQGHDQRHGQGLRHDRARHGDHAVVRVHRRADRGRRAAIAAEERRRGHFQRRHRRRRHLDLGHAARVRNRRGGRERRAENQPRQRSAAEGLHKGLPRGARRPRRTGGARRRRRAQAGRDHRRGRGIEKHRRAKSRCRWRIRRW